MVRLVLHAGFMQVESYRVPNVIYVTEAHVFLDSVYNLSDCPGAIPSSSASHETSTASRAMAWHGKPQERSILCRPSRNWPFALRSMGRPLCPDHKQPTLCMLEAAVSVLSYEYCKHLCPTPGIRRFKIVRPFIVHDCRCSAYHCQARLSGAERCKHAEAMHHVPL